MVGGQVTTTVRSDFQEGEALSLLSSILCALQLMAQESKRIELLP